MLFDAAMICSLLAMLLGLECRETSEGKRTTPRNAICTSDADCVIGEEYCMAGKCSEYGSCNSFVDCLNPSNTYIHVDDGCVGNTVCWEESGTCGINCTSNDNNQEFCPPEDGEISASGSNCLEQPAPPCEIQTCLKPDTVCVNDYSCNRCQAIFFDAAGTQVCTGNPCTSSDDCPGRQYCSAGECMEAGTCNTVADCYNPDHLFRDTRCTGELHCREGLCKRKCGPCQSSCDSFEICSTSKCSSAFHLIDNTTCVGDFCNCRDFFFDLAGNEVC